MEHSTSKSATGQSQIASIVIPTCNRVDLLKRGLTSYIESCKLFGRDNNFVIGDDSHGADTREACRKMLGELKKHYDVEIFYAGLEEKLRYAKRLIQDGAAPPAVIKFALFDSEKVKLSTLGANRNSILLHTIGDLILTVDDDTVCKLTPSPELKPGIRSAKYNSFSTYRFEDTWIYADRKHLLESIRVKQADILSIHEQLLGRNLSEFVDSGLPCDHGGTAHRVAVTATGLAGDSTWPSPFIYFFLTGQSRRRFTESRNNYDAALISREILRVTNTVTITDGTDATPGASFGLDNRDLLPPFLPVAVAEDLVFWRTLSKSFGRSYIAHLPWALLHLPEPPRRHQTGDLMKGTMGIQFYIVLLALISVAEQEHSFKKVDDGIRELGRYLEKIGSLPKCDFEEIVRSSVLKEIGLLVSYLESSLTTYEEIPDYWLADVKRLISNMRKSFSRPEISVPLDLLHNRSVDEAQEMTQRIVRKFGQLLRWWPDIVESARRLKHEEFNIAQPVPAALGSGIRCDYYVAG